MVFDSKFFRGTAGELAYTADTYLSFELLQEKTGRKAQ
jgi:hypothetical protein